MTKDRTLKQIITEQRAKIEELKLVAEEAHKTAQWTMDANRRQVVHIQELEAKVEAANQKLAEFPKCRSFNHITQKFAEEDQEIKRWLEEMKVCLSQGEMSKE